MSPAWIRKRKTAAGRARHQVLYRRGGREATIESAGTFQRDREARLRRDLVAGWLAQGLDPKSELAKLLAPAPAARSFAETGSAMLATRNDLAASTLQLRRLGLAKVAQLRPDLVERAPDAWTVQDVQEVVAAMVKDDLSPGTIREYVGTVKQTLDYAGVEPNVARDRRVKLPAQERPEVQPPSKAEFLAILRNVAARYVLALIVLEQTAMRVGELASLPWGDVDVAGNRFRLSRERTKTRHPRWVQVPDWLMPHVLDLCALEDRTAARRVFQMSEGSVREAMSRACQLAGVANYTPHDLRHRRASLWHGQGVTVRELMERGGWKKSEVAIDTYSHVMPLDEAVAADLEALLVRTR